MYRAQVECAPWTRTPGHPGRKAHGSEVRRPTPRSTPVLAVGSTISAGDGRPWGTRLSRSVLAALRGREGLTAGAEGERLTAIGGPGIG